VFRTVMGRNLRRAAGLAGCIAALALASSTALASFPGANGRIVYTTGTGATYEVHTVLPDGRGDRVIAHDGGGLTWSPNGRRLAFTGPGSNIFTMRADGSDRRQLTFDGDNLAPQYSPAGDRIVFTHVGTSDGFITTIRIDGSHRRTLGRGGAEAWAPSGEIAYIGARPTDSQSYIWEMRPDGTQKHRLVGLGEFGGYGPIYSPDGKRFLFVRFGGERFNQQVFLANGDGSAVRQPPCTPFSPLAYSPDGQWILGDSKQGDRGSASLNVVRSTAPCNRAKVASPVNLSEADWQALPSS
jgi:hypothetical protein